MRRVLRACVGMCLAGVLGLCVGGCAKGREHSFAPVQESVRVSASFLFPPEGFDKRFADETGAIERRVLRAIPQGMHRLDITESKASKPSKAVRSLLLVRTPEHGVLLTELEDHERKQSVAFDPPLVLMPVHLTSESVETSGRFSMRPFGRPRSDSDESGAAMQRVSLFSAAAASGEGSPSQTVVRTELVLETRFSVIRRISEMFLEPDRGVEREHQRLTVTAGPLTVVDRERTFHLVEDVGTEP